MKKALNFYLLIACTEICFSQSLSRNEFVKLANNIDSLVRQRDSIYDAKRPSQFIYLLININSKGNIDKLNLSGVKTDTLYRILSDLNPADLSNWQCLNCKGKTIVVPLFYISGNSTNDQVEQMFSAHYSRIPQKDMIAEIGSTVLVRYIVLNSQKKQFEETPPNKVIKIETAQKD